MNFFKEEIGSGDMHTLDRVRNKKPFFCHMKLPNFSFKNILRCEKLLNVDHHHHPEGKRNTSLRR